MMNPQLSHSARDYSDRLRHFEAVWSNGQVPDVASYLREACDNDKQFIEDLIEIDLECRWKQFNTGSDPVARDNHGFPLFPLVDDYADVLPKSLQKLIFTPHCVAEEYRVRSRWGDRPTKESFFERFPEDRTALEEALQQIDTDFENEGIKVSEDSSHSIAAAGEPTVILGRSVRKKSTLVPETDLVGSQIGKYQLKSRLGHGAFGEVWNAYDPGLKRYVAIKFPRFDKHFSDQLLETFRTEAQKLAVLEHIPGIVDVFDCGEHEGKPFFVAKLIEGESLADRMQREKLTPENSAVLIAKVAETLKRAHQRKLVHRDLKPANILLDKEGNPFLADFGMASTEQEQLHEPGGILGTIAYMAPEQARGDSHRVDGRADIYALGVILYRLLTNELPYGGKDTAQFLDNIQNQKPRPPRQIDDSIPAELERICLKCLKKDEEERFSSAGELSSQLQSWNAPRRHTMLIGVCVAAVSLLISSGAYSLWKTTRPSPKPGAAVSTRPLWADPKEIVWSPTDNFTDKRGYNLENRSYEFDTRGPALFQVAKCDADQLTLSTIVRIHGHQQTGQAGIFWAFGRVLGDEEIDACCWNLQVGRISELAIAENQLVIQQFELSPNGGRHFIHKRHIILEIPVEQPLNAVYQIELQIDKSEITHLVINGKQMLKEPLTLNSPRTRDWKKLKGTGFGFCGELGSFSVEEFASN